MKTRSDRPRKRKLTSSDFAFLLGTDLCRVAPEEARGQLMASLAPLNVKAGTRIIRQGDPGDCLFLIQDGSCSVIVETEGKENPIARFKSGDLIGEMAIVTGENRAAHVDAETDMTLWRMSGLEFDELCRAFPGIRDFVTEIVTNRLSRSKLTAHKSIGKYLITGVIDEGGWGIVYRGIHASLNLPVAIKMLKHTMAMDPDFSERFQNEAHVIARLNHPNIVRVYDIEHLYRTIFIVMEYLSGFSLKYILENMPRFSLPRILNLLIQVSQGLEYAHNEGIVHQDVKPDNIFVEEGDRAKIVDFGLACPIGTGEELDLIGTPYYMSPEQITGDLVDQRADIYSLGITAFEMATGQKPFFGPDVGEILKAHQEMPCPDARSLNPDLPPEFNAFIQRATQKDPSRRYQTMGQALADLKTLAEEHLTNQAAERRPGFEQMVLLMSYGDVDRLELTRLIEDFGEQIKRLGIELSVANFRRGDSV